MPDGEPTKAPLIIFGTMVTMSIVSVAIVFYTHSRRTEPYLDTKMRRIKRVRRAPAAEPPASIPSNIQDGGSRDGGSRDGASSEQGSEQGSEQPATTGP